MKLSRLKGNIAEELASKYLDSLGFEIVCRNYYAKKMGELDIIAKKNGVVHFVEVKSGHGFEPIYNITPSKQQKLIKSAELYLKANNITNAFCIDALIIQDGEIELIENITL